MPPLSAIEGRFLERWNSQIQQREEAPAGGVSHASTLIYPEIYRQCFYSAARRISTALNSVSPHSICKQEWLASTDDQLKDHFEAEKLDKQLYRLKFVESGDDVDPVEKWTDDFYVRFRFDERSAPRRIFTIFEITDTFLDGSFEGLHPPGNFGQNYTADELQIDEINRSAVLRDCATNYLVRNYWHNYVHSHIHHHTNENYRHISGQARYEADFEADNWSYLFLASSYGKVVRSDDERGLRPDEDVRRLLRRNRCNNVFILRAAHRGELDDQPATAVDQFEEQEWRYRRSLANYLSGWLICHRRAAVSLAIYLTGSINLQKQIYKRDDAKVVVQINRIRIPTLIDAVVQEDNKEEQRRQFREICQKVDTDYRRYLRQPQASEFAQTRLRRLYQLAKVPFL
ncbi:MAG: hypothetical protein MN733_25535 [Nitrososphaera sp.]|nr:hypothetical protein [Nitrososphaera sp.]